MSLELAVLFIFKKKVDTLRLAIGYISFLAELVANDRHPADVLQNAVPEPPKKIFISSTKAGEWCCIVFFLSLPPFALRFFFLLLGTADEIERPLGKVDITYTQCRNGRKLSAPTIRAKDCCVTGEFEQGLMTRFRYLADLRNLKLTFVINWSIKKKEMASSSVRLICAPLR